MTAVGAPIPSSLACGIVETIVSAASFAVRCACGKPLRTEIYDPRPTSPAFLVNGARDPAGIWRCPGCFGATRRAAA